MKKILIALVLVTFLLSLPVFSEAREALPGDETQMPAPLFQTGSLASLQTISLGIGRRRVRRHRHERRRRHARRRRQAGLPRRAVIRYRGRTYVVTRKGRRVIVRPR